LRKVVSLLCLVCAIAYAGLPEELGKIRKTLRSDPGKAQALVSTLLLGNESSADVQAAAGDVAFRQGEFERADQRYRTALSLASKSPRALRGQGRLALICSYRQTAKRYFESAYAADPNDHEILRDWAGTQHGDAELAALDRYLSIAQGADEDELEDVRAHIAMHKGTRGRDVNRLASDYVPSLIKLERVMNAARDQVRGYSIAIRLNDSKTFRLLLDTGASGIILNSKAGRKANLQPLSPTPLRGVGEDTDHSGYVSLVDRLTVGTVQFKDYIVRVSEDSPVRDVDGIIGADVFQQFSIKIDFRKAAVHLEPFVTEEGKPVDPEDGDYNRVRRPGFIDVFRLGAQLLIPGTANDSSTVLFLLDSGAYANLLSREFAQQVSDVRSEASLRLSGVAGKVKDVYKIDRLKLRFAGIEQTSSGVLSFDFSNLCREEGVQIAGLLGLPTLADFVLELDYRNGLVRFTPR
jgi:tetratricopeptide (TPR) repeat protein